MMMIVASHLNSFNLILSICATSHAGAFHKTVLEVSHHILPIHNDYTDDGNFAQNLVM